MGLSDAESENLGRLMEGYQEGSLQAFEELYRILRGRLFQYLLSQTLNRGWAEDLLQETFMQIHRSRRTFLPGRPVWPWALAVARHVFLMNRRAGARRNRVLSVMEPDSLPEIPVPARIEVVVEERLVRRALSGLSHEQREAVLLHHCWGLSFPEISTILGVSAGTAKLRAFRGIRKLRELLGLETVTGEASPAN